MVDIDNFIVAVVEFTYNNGVVAIVLFRFPYSCLVQL